MLGDRAVRRLGGDFLFVDHDLQFLHGLLRLAVDFLVPGYPGLLRHKLPGRAVDFILEALGEAAQPMDFT
jgi:hypothetical protein